MNWNIFSKLKYLISCLFISGYILCYAYDMPLINEVMYDPVGADAGKEWIEIYNPSPYPYSLLNWTIQTAGSFFKVDFTFPDIIIQPGEYIIVGEYDIEFADFIANLDLQNGGSATDGVRLVSADSSYTDTLLYDSPNSNNLPDDTHNPGISFVSTVTPGYTLARFPNGYDTNQISNWQAAQYPSPKQANFSYYDLEIKDLNLSIHEDNCTLQIIIHDLSTSPVSNLDVKMSIIHNQEFIFLNAVNLLFNNRIALYDIVLNISLNSLNTIITEISYAQDVDNSNNLMEIAFFHGVNPLIINEVQFQPLSDEPEWIEFYNRTDEFFQINNAFIQDAAGGKAFFTAGIPAHDYLIVTQNQEMLLEKFPELNPKKLVQPSTWAILNNTTETIELFLHEQVKVDSISYVGHYSMRGISLERKNPYDDNNYEWHYSVNERGSTPLQVNSVLPENIKVIIEGIKLNIEDNQLLHAVKLLNTGMQDEINATLRLSHKAESDNIFSVIECIDFTVFEELELVFYSNIPKSSGYHFYKYDIMTDVHLLPEAELIVSYLKNDEPVVINEIMFNPNSGEPEWIEFYQKRQTDYTKGLKFFADNDSIHIPSWNGSFALLTATRNDSIFMRENYNIHENVPIFKGLKNLNNSGESFILLDYDNNVYEKFSYYGDWSFEKGVSTERISTVLTPDSQNWTPSLNTSTPGRINSVQMNIVPSVDSFIIENNPFSPYKNEHCIISVRVPAQKVKTEILIFDLKGRKVKVLADNTITSGDYSFLWNGNDDSNKKLAPGVYPCLIKVKDLSGRSLMEKKKLIYIGY